MFVMPEHWENETEGYTGYTEIEVFHLEIFPLKLYPYT